MGALMLRGFDKWTDLVASEEEPRGDSGVLVQGLGSDQDPQALLISYSQVSSVKWGDVLSDAPIPTHSHIQLILG